jgi:hypothetical protein
MESIIYTCVCVCVCVELPSNASTSCEFQNFSVFEMLLFLSRPSFKIESSCNVGRWFKSLISHWLIWTEVPHPSVGYQRCWSTKLKLYSSSAQWNSDTWLQSFLTSVLSWIRHAVRVIVGPWNSKSSEIVTGDIPNSNQKWNQLRWPLQYVCRLVLYRRAYPNPPGTMLQAGRSCDRVPMRWIF